MASGNARASDLGPWMHEVTKLSGGTLRIRLVPSSAQRTFDRSGPDFETVTIRDVEQGKAALGWVGSRAFDAVGVTSFDALHAPFLIDSYALEQAVVQSRGTRQMLADLHRLGLAGIAVLPGPLRRILSSSHPVRTPADFAGLRFGYQGAIGIDDALRMLGARPVQLGVGAPWRGIDAVEQQLFAMVSNTYDTFAHDLTANVALWPRPMVIFANPRALAKLTRKQRAALVKAPQSVVPETTALLRSEDDAALAEMCRGGIALVTASANDQAQLRAAVAPIFDRLDRDPATRSFIAAVRSLRARIAPAGEAPLRCPAATRPPASTLPEGDYAATITRADVARERAQLPRDQWAPAGLGQPDVGVILRSRFTLRLRHGIFTLYQRHDGRTEVGVQGNYSLFHDRFIGQSSSAPDTLRGRWSFDGTRLRFGDFSPHGAYRVVWSSEPWVRVR